MSTGALMRIRPGTDQPPRRRERGAVLVEASLVTGLFLVLVFFIFEMGFLFRDSLTTSNASREAARAASTLGRDRDTDFYTIRTVEHGLEAMGLQSLDVLVIFKATGPGDTVPGACLSSSQSGLCNRYTPIDFFAEKEDTAGNPTGNFGCGTLDGAWCPTSREAQASVGPDYVGVYVRTKHSYLTGMFGTQTDLEATTVLRIEPDKR
ncbi:MAG: pilus assembly protein [Acidimicrobiia bacterium]|nr:pilus assembly protein [Acidimicrobiia bacterium]MDH5520766.1 pilus assembly protein [Acidimicrobiia bacterium]